MNETTRVWDFGLGWGAIAAVRWGDIVAVNGRETSVYPIEVQFDRPEYIVYTVRGYCGSHHIRTLFWDVIKFEAPPRPKRKVKKVVEEWVNIQEMETGINHCQPPLWRTCKEALSKRAENCIYLGEPLFIRHEYEVEE